MTRPRIHCLAAALLIAIALFPAHCKADGSAGNGQGRCTSGNGAAVVCPTPPPGVLQLSPVQLPTVAVGGTTTLTVSEGAYAGAFTVSSGSTAIATVALTSGGGTSPSVYTITGVANGAAVITVSDNLGGRLTSLINVSGGALSLNKIQLTFHSTSDSAQTFVATESGVTITAGDSAPAIVSLSPATASGCGSGCTFSVSPIALGTNDTITVSDGTSSQDINVDVQGPLTTSPSVLPALNVSGTTTLAVSEANYKFGFTATSSDPTVATVSVPTSQLGPGPVSYTITAIAAGSVNILVNDDGHSTQISLGLTISASQTDLHQATWFVSLNGSGSPGSSSSISNATFNKLITYAWDNTALGAGQGLLRCDGTSTGCTAVWYVNPNTLPCGNPANYLYKTLLNNSPDSATNAPLLHGNAPISASSRLIHGIGIGAGTCTDGVNGVTRNYYMPNLSNSTFSTAFKRMIAGTGNGNSVNINPSAGAATATGASGAVNLNFDSTSPTAAGSCAVPVAQASQISDCYAMVFHDTNSDYTNHTGAGGGSQDNCSLELDGPCPTGTVGDATTERVTGLQSARRAFYASLLHGNASQQYSMVNAIEVPHGTYLATTLADIDWMDNGQFANASSIKGSMYESNGWDMQSQSTPPTYCKPWTKTFGQWVNTAINSHLMGKFIVHYMNCGNRATNNNFTYRDWAITTTMLAEDVPNHDVILSETTDSVAAGELSIMPEQLVSFSSPTQLPNAPAGTSILRQYVRSSSNANFLNAKGSGCGTLAAGEQGGIADELVPGTCATNPQGDPMGVYVREGTCAINTFSGGTISRGTPFKCAIVVNGTSSQVTPQNNTMWFPSGTVYTQRLKWVCPSLPCDVVNGGSVTKVPWTLATSQLDSTGQWVNGTSDTQAGELKVGVILAQ